MCQLHLSYLSRISPLASYRGKFARQALVSSHLAELLPSLISINADHLTSPEGHSNSLLTKISGTPRPTSLKIHIRCSPRITEAFSYHWLVFIDPSNFIHTCSLGLFSINLRAFSKIFFTFQCASL